MFKGINRHEMSILASKRHIMNIKLLLCFHSSRTENGICKAPQKLLINFTSWSVNNRNYSAFELSGENKSRGEIRFDLKSWLVIWCNINAYSLVFSLENNLLPSKAKMQPGSALMPVRRSCCQRTLSISCEWGGNYPWSVNTIHPQHLTCIWDRHSHAGPLLTIGPPCPQQMNSYIHLHKFHGSWLNPFMDQIVPPATTRCYCSTNLFNFFFLKTHTFDCKLWDLWIQNPWSLKSKLNYFGKKKKSLYLCLLSTNTLNADFCCQAWISTLTSVMLLQHRPQVKGKQCETNQMLGKMQKVLLGKMQSFFFFDALMLSRPRREYPYDALSNIRKSIQNNSNRNKILFSALSCWRKNNLACALIIESVFCPKI